MIINFVYFHILQTSYLFLILPVKIVAKALLVNQIYIDIEELPTMSTLSAVLPVGGVSTEGIIIYAIQGIILEFQIKDLDR